MTQDFSGREAATVIRERAKTPPHVAMVLGSGLGALADDIDNAIAINYDDLPGFPGTGVSGHAGKLILGELNGVPVACMQGRQHFYEGDDPRKLAIPPRALKQAGAEILVLTNAAGSLQADMPPGSLMLLSDHINFVGTNPLIGPNDDAIGPRFFNMRDAYDPDLRAACQKAGTELGVDFHQGVYAWYCGPNFETPAEIRLLSILGADAVGMSTVPECLAARHCGLKVLAISNITNLAEGMSAEKLSHEHTLAQAEAGAVKLRQVLKAAITEF